VLARRAGRLWRRKSSRTRAEQGLWHQWQPQVGKVATGEDALLEVMAVHGWAVDASAGVAAADISEGAVSTASEPGAGEP